MLHCRKISDIAHQQLSNTYSIGRFSNSSTKRIRELVIDLRGCSLEMFSLGFISEIIL